MLDFFVLVFYFILILAIELIYFYIFYLIFMFLIKKDSVLAVFMTLLVVVLADAFGMQYVFLLMGVAIAYKIYRGEKRDIKDILIIKNRDVLKIFLSFFIAINVSTYLFLRYETIDKNRANLLAKEYYVVGDVLFAFRKILMLPKFVTRIYYPEDYFIRPLEYLQRMIFNSGVKHLPKDDAEWGLWEYHFFVYPYARIMHTPGNPRKDAIIPHYQKTVDRSFEALRAIATKPIKDKKMNQEEKYLIYPVFAMFYEHQQF